MTERVPASAETSRGDAASTFGLLLNVTAVIAFAICLGAFGLADMASAAVAGVVAVASFAGSIACFRADAAEMVPGAAEAHS